MCVSSDEQLSKLFIQTVADVTTRYANAGYFPDAAVRVFNKDGTICTFCHGQATQQSVFDVASLTKIATATMVLLDIEAGRIALDAPVSNYFEEIREDAYLCARFQGVTVYGLLTHTSTLVDWYPLYMLKGLPFFAALRVALQLSAPTEGMVYSDLNFMLLGKLLERVNHMPLADCLTEKLVVPYDLGVMGYCPKGDVSIIPTGFGNPSEERMCRERGLVFTAFRDKEKPVVGGTHDGNAHYYFDEVAGHAGIFAQPKAYENLCRLYMNTQSPLLMRATKAQVATRGLGLEVGAMYPMGCGHTGFTGTSIYFSREENIGVVAFTNRLFFKELNPRLTSDYRRALHEAVYALNRTWRTKDIL